METPDGNLHYLDWRGSGPLAHFLHGNGFCAGTYSPFIELLIGEFHIIASDVRGRGGSDQFNIEPIRNWTLFAEDLKRCWPSAGSSQIPLWPNRPDG